jgi:hypothetical protein
MPGRASQAGAAVAERGTDAASARRHPAQEGSCQTCVHRPRCLFFKAARRPIVFCEEFDGQPHGAADPDADGRPPVAGHNLEPRPPADARQDCDEQQPACAAGRARRC